MRFIKIYLFLILVCLFASCSGQIRNNHSMLGKAYAQEELHLSLSDSTRHNVIDNQTMIIKDSLTAINMAEPILFSIYGKDHIIDQRPYEIYLFDNYWVISGTLPVNYLGGTFLIIIDARNGRVIRITHGK